MKIVSFYLERLRWNDHKFEACCFFRPTLYAAGVIQATRAYSWHTRAHTNNGWWMGISTRCNWTSSVQNQRLYWQLLMTFVCKILKMTRCSYFTLGNPEKSLIDNIQFSYDFTYQELLKLVNFWLSKNIKIWTDFWDTLYTLWLLILRFTVCTAS